MSSQPKKIESNMDLGHECGVCNLEISAATALVLCSVCKKYIHINDKCCSMKGSTWIAKSKEQKAKWTCLKCKENVPKNLSSCPQEPETKRRRESYEEDDIREFLKDQFKDVNNNFKEMRQNFQEVQENFQKLDIKVSDIDNNISAMKCQITSMKEDIVKTKKELTQCLLENKNLTEKCKKLEERMTKQEKEIEEQKGVASENKYKLIDLEQYIRKKNVIINDLPVNIDIGNSKEIIIELAKNMNVNITMSDIIECHPLPSRSNNNLTLIVQFTNNEKKREFMRNKRNAFVLEAGKKKKVYLNDHLAPFFQKLLKEAKMRARVYLYKYVWHVNGKIIVKKDDNTPRDKILVIKTEEDLNLIK